MLYKEVNKTIFFHSFNSSLFPIAPQIGQMKLKTLFTNFITFITCRRKINNVRISLDIIINGYFRFI